MYRSDIHLFIGQCIVLVMLGLPSVYAYRSDMCDSELRKIERIKQKDEGKYNDYVSCIKKCKSTYLFYKHGTYCKEEMRAFYDSVSETI